MKTHELKTHSEYFGDVWNNIKQFEVRLNDRLFMVGDKVVLKEFHPRVNSYSGCEIIIEITYILKNYPALKKNYIVFGFKILQKIRK